MAVLAASMWIDVTVDPGCTFTVTVFLFRRSEGKTFAVSGAKKSLNSPAFPVSTVTGVLLIVASIGEVTPPVR
jgi:hypothetical protein